MRIGIDARMYQEGLGIGRYISELIHALEKIDTQNEYIIFLRRSNWNAYMPSSPNFTKRLADVPWYSFAEQYRLPFILWRERLDLMHFPHFAVPLLYLRPFVVTIHDLIMLKLPRSSRLAATTHHALWYSAKYFAYRILISTILRRAKAVITVSQNSKNDILTTYHINQKRIHVIYNGVLPKAATIEQPLHFIKKPYFLCVGSAYPHKNLDRLLLAWKTLTSPTFGYYLVFCGQEDYFASKLRNKISQMGLEKSVWHIGCVPDAQLAWLYSNAVALIIPSIEEGFGLTAVEALNYGTPVLASALPVFREVLGDAALYFNPHDENAIAVGILEMIRSTHVWRTKAYAYQEITLKRFQWQACARETLALYHDAVN